MWNMRLTLPEADSLTGARVAAEVRAEMGRQKVSARVLAERLGWSQQRLSRRLTTGTTFVAFTVDELVEVANELDVRVTRFIGADVAASAA